MTEPLDLDALRRLAEAATPGPWLVEREPGGFDVASADDLSVASGGPDGGAACSEADAEFIAATDPPTVLALLDALAAARAEADELRRTLLDETYRAEGGEIVMRELGAAKRDRDAALAELAALRAQVEASTARARDAITEDATS